MPAHIVVNQDVSPWSALYQANRFAVRSADGTWFYAFQDGVKGRVLWASPDGLVDIPLTPQPTMRPTLYADPSGLYCIAGFDGDKKHLVVWQIDEYRSVFAHPVAIPPNGAIDSLYDDVYVPADFDTPAEIALRVQKQLDAIQELVELLKQVGVLV